jgi:hypothetical protein
MARLVWNPEALLGYGEVRRVGGALHDRVDEALDRLEDDPGQAALRSQAFRDRSGRPLWAIAIRTYTEDVLLLWQQHPTEADGVLIAYLGANVAGVRD